MRSPWGSRWGGRGRGLLEKARPEPPPTERTDGLGKRGSHEPPPHSPLTQSLRDTVITSKTSFQVRGKPKRQFFPGPCVSCSWVRRMSRTGCEAPEPRQRRLKRQVDSFSPEGGTALECFIVSEGAVEARDRTRRGNGSTPTDNGAKGAPQTSDCLSSLRPASVLPSAADHWIRQFPNDMTGQRELSSSF